MSMQTISSPRLARRGTRRRPMNPVPPRIRIDMMLPPRCEKRCGCPSLDLVAGLRNAAAPGAGSSRLSLERGAVPRREVGGRGVGALQEIEQQLARRGGLADRVIGQDELADLLAVIAGIRLDLGIAKAGRLRVGVAIKGGLAEAAIARPKAAAADLVRIG